MKYSKVKIIQNLDNMIQNPSYYEKTSLPLLKMVRKEISRIKENHITWNTILKILKKEEINNELLNLDYNQEDLDWIKDNSIKPI